MATEAQGAKRRTTFSSCYMCTDNCPITVVSEGSRILSIEHPDCVRASAMLEQRESRQRLTAPMIRASARAPWKRASWDEALTACSEKMLEIRDRYGPASVAFVAGYTKEARPYLSRLCRLFGSPHYLTESSCCFASGFIAARVTLGREYEYFLAPSRRRYPQTECRLVWSGNPGESQAPFDAHHLLTEAAAVPTIVVDPRRTPLAEGAALHLRIRPGTDGALALALAHVIFEEDLQDQDFLDHYGHGVEAYREYVKAFDPARACRITGVPREHIVEAARLYGGSHPAQITISANATTHHSGGFQAHRAILLLAALCGNLDVEGGNRPWSERLVEKSLVPPGFPDEAGQALGKREFPLFVRHYREGQAMLLPRAIESGAVRAVFALGLNLMMWPNSKRLQKALTSLEMFATADFFPNPTVNAATCFFPAATHLERAALVVGGTGRIRFRPAAVLPRGEACGDTELIFRLADRLGLRDGFWDGDAAAACDERLEGSGFRFADLPKDGKPVRAVVCHPAERSYRTGGFGTPTGKVEFVSTQLEDAGYEGLPVYREPHWSPLSTPEVAAEYPLVLTSGGRSRNYTHSQGRELETLRSRELRPRLQINPVDAISRAISDGDRVEVSSPIGTVAMFAEVTEVVPAGTVHAFHGWPGHNINEIIPDEGLDPISGYPPFKSSLCQARRP
jgi:anaerobic selenocysteine-containing dehydrogenase